MSQVTPPVGKRDYYQSRENVLEAVRALCPGEHDDCSADEIQEHLGGFVALLGWHLMILADRGEIEWVRRYPATEWNKATVRPVRGG